MLFRSTDGDGCSRIDLFECCRCCLENSEERRSISEVREEKRKEEKRRDEERRGENRIEENRIVKKRREEERRKEKRKEEGESETVR